MEKNIAQMMVDNGIPIDVVDEKRAYWLVRTQSGEYYDQFFHDNYIAVGWDEFNDIKFFQETEKSIAIKKIEETYPDEKQPGRIYGQIYRFLFEIKPGDIVMIPSHNSTHISFGVVLSSAYIEDVEENEIEEGDCPFNKRRKVKWMKTVKRSDLDPFLYKMMQSHHTISKANDYAHFIDRTLSSFFIKGNKAHLVISVKRNDDIPAIELMGFVQSMLDLVPAVNELELADEKFEKKDIDMKLNVQSPGIIEFFSTAAPWCIAGLGLVLVGIVGGNLKATFTKEKTEINNSSDGLIEKLLKWKKQKDAHELKKLELTHKQSLEKIQAEIPAELKKLLEKSVRED